MDHSGVLSSKEIALILFLNMCVCVWSVSVEVYMWRSEDNLVETFYPSTFPLLLG